MEILGRIFSNKLKVVFKILYRFYCLVRLVYLDEFIYKVS